MTIPSTSRSRARPSPPALKRTSRVLRFISISPCMCRIHPRRIRGISCPGQDDLECAGVAGTGEDVVGLFELAQREVMRDEATGVDLMAGHETQQRRCGVGVDEAGGDGDV